MPFGRCDDELRQDLDRFMLFQSQEGEYAESEAAKEIVDKILHSIRDTYI